MLGGAETGLKYSVDVLVHQGADNTRRQDRRASRGLYRDDLSFGLRLTFTILLSAATTLAWTAGSDALLYFP